MKNETPTNEIPKLTLEDLEINDIDVLSLTREENLGIPEMGASNSKYGNSTTHTSQ